MIMLDFDLAQLYEVETKALNQAVKRNIKRFTADFMFRLTVAEWEPIQSQCVTASKALLCCVKWLFKLRESNQDEYSHNELL